MIAAGALALASIAAWRHPVGDYLGETDFFGGNVEGARLFMAGRPDPGRYGVVGPLYDMLLALVARVAGDLFVAAKLIAIASVVLTWILWRALVASRFGNVVALWATAFLVANPVFFQAGYSAMSHGPAICLQVASLAALLRPAKAGGMLASGALAGAATLVRYPGLALLPAAWMILWGLERTPWRSRFRSAAIHLAGFLLVTLPWTAFSLSRGHVPAEGLYGRADFYLARTAPHPQDAPGAFFDARAERSKSLLEMAGADPAGLAQQALTGAGTHLIEDARQLLGVPIAVLALLGLALALRDGTWRRLATLGAPWLVHAIILAPVYYNPQYALAQLPFYATLAGVAVGSGRWVLRARGLALKPVLALFPLALAIQATVLGTRFGYHHLPVEARAAGLALAGMAAPDQGVIARKGHVGYYSGLPVVAFPRVETIRELAAYCHSRNVHWIYYSWYEALQRPELRFLLDSTAVVPGLQLVHASQGRPCRVFRIQPGFGVEPAWWADRAQRRVHMARGAVQVLGPEEASIDHLVLAHDAAARADAPATLKHAEAALLGGPEDARAWELKGIALHTLGRRVEAQEAYRTALRLEPGLSFAQEGLEELRGVRGFTRSEPPPGAPSWDLPRVARGDTLSGFAPVPALTDTPSSERHALRRDRPAVAPPADVPLPRSGAH